MIAAKEALDDLVRLFADDMIEHRVSCCGHDRPCMVALAERDQLAMLHAPFTDLPLARVALQVIHVRESMPAPEIILIRRPDMPLTPAAGFFSDLLMREASFPRRLGRSAFSPLKHYPIPSTKRAKASCRGRKCCLAPAQV